MDLKIFIYLNNFAGKYSWLDEVVSFKAEYLGWLALGVLGIFLWFGTPPKRDKARTQLMVLHAFLAAVVSRFIFTDIIRLLYDKPRPFEVLNNIHQLIEHEIGGSFPSGHAAFFFALAAGVFIWYRWLGVLFYAFAVSITVSRVISGIHWPSDILGGALIGIFSAYILYYFILIYKKKLKEPEAQTKISPLP